jgi:hypothetical protein
VSRVVANSPRADATVPGISLAMLVAAAALLAIGLWKDLRPGPVLAGVVALAGGAWFTRDAAPIGLPQSLRPRVELPDVALATTIFESLHGNIYRAFDVSTEDAIYDLLAVSVEPALLDSLYGDIYESLILREDGGAVCVIQDVQRQSTTVLPPDRRRSRAGAIQSRLRVAGHGPRRALGPHPSARQRVPRGVHRALLGSRVAHRRRRSERPSPGGLQWLIPRQC